MKSKQKKRDWIKANECIIGNYYIIYDNLLKHYYSENFVVENKFKRATPKKVLIDWLSLAYESRNKKRFYRRYTLYERKQK